MKESMCDSCRSPGACCKAIRLSGGGRAADRHDAIQAPMSFERAEHRAMELGLWMMRPLHQDTADGSWAWECTQLQPNGRCGIYDSRPQLCRDYRPGEDPLCVHYWPDPETPTPMAEEEAQVA